MEHNSINNIISLEKKETYVETFNLISKLLSLVFSSDGEHISNLPQRVNFLWNNTIETDSKPLIAVKITSQDIINTEEVMEIDLTGELKNSKGEMNRFTLYFFIWWNRFVTIDNDCDLKNNPQIDALLSPVENENSGLHDAVFNMSLKRRVSSNQKYDWGQGRGFLLLN